MDSTNVRETFLPLQTTAGRLGVPAAWLREEALAGRVPYLRAGRRMLFAPAEVERVLIARAENVQGAAHA